MKSPVHPHTNAPACQCARTDSDTPTRPHTNVPARRRGNINPPPPPVHLHARPSHAHPGTPVGARFYYLHVTVLLILYGCNIYNYNIFCLQLLQVIFEPMRNTVEEMRLSVNAPSFPLRASITDTDVWND